MVTTIRHNNVTLVQGPRARVWVGWCDHKLPAGVALGRDIIAYGKLMTFGNARSFQIVDSVLIKGIGKQGLAAGLSKVLRKFIVEPPAKDEAKPNGHGVA